MADYKEILRLDSLRLNHSQIAGSLGISRQTVVTALSKASALGLNFETARDMPNWDIARALFPPAEGKPSYKAHDYAKVGAEMMKAGVTLQLLCVEYCDECRAAGEMPYQLTQYKKHYRDYLITTKATMHIEHRPGVAVQDIPISECFPSIRLFCVRGTGLAAFPTPFGTGGRARSNGCS